MNKPVYKIYDRGLNKKGKPGIEYEPTLLVLYLLTTDVCDIKLYDNGAYTMENEEGFYVFSDSKENVLYELRNDINDTPPVLTYEPDKIFNVYNRSGGLFNESLPIDQQVQDVLSRLSENEKIINVCPEDGMYLVTADQEQQLLELGHVCVAGIPHISVYDPPPTLISDPSLTWWYLIQRLGYCYLNMHDDFKCNKKSLMGCYHGVHVTGEERPYREKIVNVCQKTLGDEFSVMSYNKPKQDLVIKKYTHYGNWIANHISGYTDYQHNVVNLIYDRDFDQLLDMDYADYLSDSVRKEPHKFNFDPTEKTLKSILFSNTNTFFVVYTLSNIIEWMIDKGFWVLNFEFLPKTRQEWQSDLNGESLPEDLNINNGVTYSIVKTCEYLKTLKTELKTNEAVHEFLVKKYRHKLEKNHQLIQKMIDKPDEELSNRFKKSLGII